MTYAVIRVRGTVNVKKDITDNLRMLRLEHTNHCVLIPDTPQFKGMLQKGKDYITWGEIKPELVSELIKARCKIEGGEMISDAFLKKNTDFKNITELSKAISEGKMTLAKLPKVNPVLRLSPPRKGWGSIKRHFPVGGALGYRGEDINDLIRRMI